METKKLVELIKGTDTAYTHSGVFHADDVFSSALLMLINPKIKIERTFNPPEGSFHYDIGGGEYDHHDKEKMQYRDEEKEYPYASFGLLWRDLGPYLTDEKGVINIDNCLVKDIDRTDNLGQQAHPNSLSAAIGIFNPSWKDREDESITEENFDKAVAMAYGILSHKLQLLKDEAEAVEIVETMMSDNEHVLVMDTYVPWKNTVLENESWNGHFALYPSMRGGYNLEVIPMSKKDGTPRIPFPEEWWGHPENLPEGATFCHASGFLLAVEGKEIGLQIAKSLYA